MAFDPKKIAAFDKAFQETQKKVVAMKPEAEKQKKDVLLREKGLKALE
jgi:hypothetical protein